MIAANIDSNNSIYVVSQNISFMSRAVLPEIDAEPCRIGWLREIKRNVVLRNILSADLRLARRPNTNLHLKNVLMEDFPFLLHGFAMRNSIF